MSGFKLKLSRLKGMPAIKSPSKVQQSTPPNLDLDLDVSLGFGRRFFEVAKLDPSVLDLASETTVQALAGRTFGISEYTDEVVRNIVFLDTETTGLGYGASTYAFLVGLTYCVDGEWIGEQLFLEDPSQELYMLKYLAERLERAEMLITYNGKSYDLPLLNVRMTMHQLPMIKMANHIDLYHLLRGILKYRISRYRLCDVEVALLDFERKDDISGADIPAAYYDYLHGRDTGQLHQIISHNEFDVDSMVRLMNWTSALIGGHGALQDQKVEYGFLERLVNRRERVGVMDRLLRLLNQARTQWVRTRCALLVYEVLKPDDLLSAMSVLIEHYDEAKGELRSTVAKRLAIHFEHHLKDYEQALTYAEETEPIDGCYAQRRRVIRLNGKIERHAHSKSAVTSQSLFKRFEAFGL
jgi:uncharacterized protein